MNGSKRYGEPCQDVQEKQPAATQTIGTSVVKHSVLNRPEEVATPLRVALAMTLYTRPETQL